MCQCDKEQYPSGYCHDAYHAVEEGDTLLFSMQFVKKEPGANGTEHWDMHWNVAGHPLKGATALAHTSGKRLFAKTGLGQTYGRKTEVRTVRFC